jgi:hypothetical protein
MRFLPSSLAIRAGVGAAAAVIVIGSGTVAASASVATPAVGKVLTALSIGVSQPVAYQHQVTALVAGRLSEPREQDHGVRGKVVWLMRRGALGHWAAVDHAVTGTYGAVAFRVHVLQGAAFRLAFAGTPNFTPAVSAIGIVP